MNINPEPALVVYTSHGYKIDNGHGEFLFSESWPTAKEAQEYASSQGIATILI